MLPSVNTAVFLILTYLASLGMGGRSKCTLYCAVDTKAICGLSVLKGYKTFLDRCQFERQSFCSLGDYVAIHPGECTARELGLICQPQYCRRLGPVCGVSPNKGYVTFPSECHLNAENSCQNGDYSLAHPGQCTKKEIELICTLEFCLEASEEEVCGVSSTTGFVTFTNDCFMNAENTCNSGDYSVAHPGRCTPGELGEICGAKYCQKAGGASVCGISSTGKYVDFPNRCFLNEENTCKKGDYKPVHDGRCTDSEGCPGVCTTEYNPVCGYSLSNKVFANFSNQCQWEASNRCLYNYDYVFIHPGACLSNEKEPSCSNGLLCSKHYSPVCSFSLTNKRFKTFPNKCQWLVDNRCVYKYDYEFVHTGECTPKEIENVCIGRSCEKDYEPVCGSSPTTGYQTVSNICSFVLNVTCNGADYTFAHGGECTSPEGPVAGCPGICPRIYSPVCGFSLSRKKFKTFGSKCQWESDNKCKYDKDYIMVHGGECTPEELENICLRTISSLYEPVCVFSKTVGYTTVFNSEVFVLNISCNSADFVFVHQGECTREERGKCNRACAAIYKPVCGFKLQKGYKTFSSQCLLEVANKCDYEDYSLAHVDECTKEEQDGRCEYECPLEYIGVCGSSDIKGYKSFPNQCILERENSCTLSDYKIAHVGKCTDTEIGKKCNRVCHLTYNPVCGKSPHKGYKTFPNFCMLDRENSCFFAEYNVIHQGECYDWENCVNCG